MKCRKRLRDYGLGLLLVLVSNAGIFGKSKPMSEIPPQLKPKKYEIAVYNNSDDPVTIFISSELYCRAHTPLIGDFLRVLEEESIERKRPRTLREIAQPGAHICADYIVAPHKAIYANIKDFSSIKGITSFGLKQFAKLLALSYNLTVWNPKTGVIRKRKVRPGPGHFYVYPDDMKIKKKIRTSNVPLIKKSNRPAA